MSLTISPISSATSAVNEVFPDNIPKTPTRLTDAQQMHQLEVSGQSPSQIATTLGLPISLVESELNLTTTSSSAASTALAVAGHLDVQA